MNFEFLDSTWGETGNMKMTKKELFELYTRLRSDNGINRKSYANTKAQLKDITEKARFWEDAFNKAEQRRNALEYAITMMHQHAVMWKLLLKEGYNVELHNQDKVTMQKKQQDEIKLAG